MPRIGEFKRRKALEIFAEYEKRDHNVSYEGMVTLLAGKYHYNRDYIRKLITLGRKLKREGEKMQ